MRKIKTKIITLLTFSLVVCGMLFSTTKIDAASNPEDAPTDWAFEASSVALNDAIVAKYPILNNGDGFITKASANMMLGTINVAGRNITGTLNGVENFTSITALHLYSNELTGEIPSGLGELNNLTELYLFNNQLSGEIPNSLGDLSNLMYLNLRSNELRGEIPSSFGKLSSLAYFDLNSNQITGEIIDGLGDLSNLYYLDLANNQLHGEIPSSLGKLTNLAQLYLFNNQLRGEIPSRLGDLSNLQYLNASQNQLIGELPNSLGNLKNIIQLYLSNNQISGEIPSTLGDLSNLTELYLSNNQISGELPSSLANLSDLTYLDLSNNQISGELAMDLGGLHYLSILDLSNNQLSGEVPDSLGYLTNLMYMNLSNNEFRGEIPNTLSNLSGLFILNLSNNQFTSISQSTHDFLVSLMMYEFGNQTHTDTLTIRGIINTTYEFDALPAYEQFPNYGITFTYTLYLPDGTSTIINPSIVDERVSIASNELSQVGAYTLVAEGTSTNYNFTNLKYTTEFFIDEPIAYVSAEANGENNKVTSNTITINLSKTPEVGELRLEDISLIDTSNVSTAITKDSLTSLGNGTYELAISGTWNEGTDITVALTKTGVVFTPDTHTVTLHTKLNNLVENKGSIGSAEGNSNHNNTNKKEKLPKTGDTNSLAIMIFGAGLLISGGYLMTRKKSN